MSLSEDVKAIVASNLTGALATLIATGNKQEEAISIIDDWYHLFYKQLSNPSDGEKLFPDLQR